MTESEEEQELFVASRTIWRDLDIPVCFEQAVGNATQRGWVRNAVETNWEANSHVNFTGWGSCAGKTSGIFIKISDENPRTAGKGRTLDGKRNGMVLNFALDRWPEPKEPGDKDKCVTAAEKEVCIRTIAVHEFGHALGFAHEHLRDDASNCNASDGGEPGDTSVGVYDLQSVMNYCNPIWDNGGVLSAGDIQGLRQYYGSPTFASNRKDAMAWKGGKHYFFNGSQYMRYDNMFGPDSGYPKRIADYWGNWPSSWASGIDAAVLWGSKAYFFRGSQYLRYDVDNDSVDGGYPKPIIGNWSGWPTSWTGVDAAVNRGTVAYFFRGDEYLAFDVLRDRVVGGYPKKIADHWRGVYSSGITQVVDGDEVIYFFKGTEYVAYDMMFERVRDGFPKPIVGNWSGVPF